MSLLKSLFLLTSIISANSFNFKYDVKDVCQNISTNFNLINKVTSLRLDIDFEKGYSLLFGPATVEFSSEVVTNCESMQVSSGTLLIIAEITGDLTILSYDNNYNNRKVISIKECVIVCNALLERESGRVFAKVQTIESTGFRAASLQERGKDVPLVEDLVVPFLSRALSSSWAGADMNLSPFIGPEVSEKVREHLYQTISYYLTSVKL